MGKQLYLECYSGISGDMTVAALLDLGADREALLLALESLRVDGYHVEIGRANQKGIDACDFHVVLEEQEHHHEHEHEHHHEEEHHHHHHHEHRNYGDIVNIIEGSGITPNAKELAKKMFAIVAKAEGKIHSMPMEEVHFHEVGAVDSIVDIVAAAVCIDNLEIEKVYLSPLYEGTGYVSCQHGLMPVPAPATAEILRTYGIPIRITSSKGEMITPTGAAIAAALAEDYAPPAAFSIEKIGFGAGKKQFDHANVLRAYLIEAPQGAPKKKLES